MKAVVHERYGGPEVLQLREVAKLAPGERDVLIQVRAASVAASFSRCTHRVP
jgi:NADPH2:quinone reductase